MTYGDEDEEWEVCEGGDRGSPAYFGTLMDLDDKEKGKMDDGGLRPLGFHVRGVSGDKVVNIILDSGADMSALPMEYFTIGKWLSKRSVLKDAEGRTMKCGDLRQALVVLEGGEGNQVHMRETFALSNVKEPLLALGKLIKKGWKAVCEQDGVMLSFGTFHKSVQFRNRSLVTSAVIRRAEEETQHVRTATMTFMGLMRDLVDAPGWHLLLDRGTLFVVVLHSENYKDSVGQVDRVAFPYRTTLVKKGDEWELVEMAERKANEDEIPECADGPTIVVSSIWAPSTQVLTIPFFDLETLSLQKSKSKHEALGGMVELWRMTSTWAHNMKQLKVIRCLWWDKKGQLRRSSLRSRLMGRSLQRTPA